MHIPLEFYEVLRSRITLSEIVRKNVTLSRKGGEYSGLCPFHNEKSPSFTVNDVKRFYHCFGCAAHGDVIKFISSLSGLSYKDSAIKLAQDYGIELPELTKEQEKFYEETDYILDILKLATEFFMAQLTSQHREYLKKRGIDDKIISEFNIGFAPGNGRLIKFFESKSIPVMDLAKAGLVGKREERIYEIFHDRIIFPIKNIYNKVIAFGGRVINDNLPKYLNSPETIIFKKKETLYGENQAITASYKKNYIILVEGYMDVLALHKAGLTESVASLGTSVTEGHIQKLWRACDEIILCLDGDSAGIKATKRAITTILPLISAEKNVSFIKLEAGFDPDDIINNQGAEEFNKLLKNRINLSEMIWQLEFTSKNFSNPESIVNLENSLQNYCKQIKNKNLSIGYLRFFKDLVWQNLIKKSNKKSKNIIFSSAKDLSVTNCEYSEIERLEHALCCFIVKFPEMLSSDQIINFLQNIHFNNFNLTEFRDWYLETITVHREKINKVVEKTRFYDTFLLLSKSNNLFLDISNSEKISNPLLLWEWLNKKYYLALLKIEYIVAVNSESYNSFEKATLYQEEIRKTSKELQDLNESFN